MSKSKLTQSFKEVRNGLTQEQLAMELNVSRESISKYENGHVRIPADITNILMAKADSPRLAFAIRNEYTKTGPIWLDGPNADLHRSSVREKALEEIAELVKCLTEFSFAKPLKNLSEWEKPKLHHLLEEAVEAITGLEHLLVVVCEETGISYTDVWQNHHTQLRAKGYVQ
ncbi:helix-turn-helix domain-containing protein [Planococcus versutus]|uniref:Transcriptional regulator n=1 Tax=Planococcus versutus TaxID=1302659 RepID=A0A1B1S5F2_9BACL|nr:helix-turn-helix transcriptional regulator [Planococcus versutus]ANU28422.1 transcriptional regulator [Planococcus versutus]